MLENGQPMHSIRRYAADTERQQVVSGEGVVEFAKLGSTYTFRWDNTYSIVRHKRVQYRFLVTSLRAYTAAQTAAKETHKHHILKPSSSLTKSNGNVKPHIAKRLALERRLTVDEKTLEQTQAIERLQRCVVDMVTLFMMEPDCPLHDGAVREFIVSLESVLRNGIKVRQLIRIKI